MRRKPSEERSFDTTRSFRVDGSLLRCVVMRTLLRFDYPTVGSVLVALHSAGYSARTSVLSPVSRSTVGSYPSHVGVAVADVSVSGPCVNDRRTATGGIP